MIEFNVETLFSYFMQDRAQQHQHQRAGKVQDLRSSSFCPHDFLCENEKGQKVYGIPDRTLDVLLGRLASAKGDNIVWLTILP